MAFFIRPLILLATIVALNACVYQTTPPQALSNATPRGPSLSSLAEEQAIDIAEPLSPESLAVIAVFTNPDLKALRASEGVANAQVFAAGQYPDPSFSLGAERPLNGTGLVAALTAGLGYDFASVLSRPAKMRGARANLESIRFDIAWAEWLTGQQARLLSSRISHLLTIKTMTAQLRVYADEDLARALRASSRGDLPAAAAEARRIAAADAADRDRSAQLQLRSAQLDLHRLLGIDPDELLNLAPSATSAKIFPPNETLVALAVAKRADLRGLRARYEGSQAAVDLANLTAYPLPALDISFARDTSDFRTLGPSVSFALPIWNKGKGDVAVALATQEQLRAEYAARLETVRADIAAAHAALEITRAQRADVAREIQPLLPQASADDRAADRGDIAQSTASAAHMTVLDKQIVEAGLALAEVELEVALEISIGQLLEAN